MRCLFIGDDWDGMFINVAHPDWKLCVMPERTTDDFATFANVKPVPKQKRELHYTRMVMNIWGQEYIVFVRGVGEEEVLQRCKNLL
jgi:hypothetical protein